MSTCKPTPDQIRAVRVKAKLSRKEAAALIGKPVRTWDGWECATDRPGHRGMDAALFDYFKSKLSKL